MAEYTALVLALQAAQKFGADEVSLFADSELMVKQLTGVYKVRDPKMLELFQQAQRILITFQSWRIKHVRRELNSLADTLANKALDARKDVVEVQLGDARPHDRPQELAADTAEMSTPADPAAPQPAGTRTAAAVPPVIVKVIRPAQAGGCKAGTTEGQPFIFGETAPAEMCIYALKAVLDTVLAMRYAAGENEPLMPVRVRCGRRGCGAEFDIRLGEVATPNNPS